jgi:hypothetical protein
MATERLSMRKTREILRLKWGLDRSHREVARSLGVSLGMVGVTLKRAENAGLDWATAQMITDEELERRLYLRPGSTSSCVDPESRWPCSTWSTWSGIRTGTSTPSSVSTTGGGACSSG